MAPPRRTNHDLALTGAALFSLVCFETHHFKVKCSYFFNF
jgi:hypothetical protein